MPTDHEVERIARLMHEAFNEWQARWQSTECRRVKAFESLSDDAQNAHRHVARRVIDDPGKRM